MARYNCIMALKLKRIYEEPAASDGFRILVDRLWPRGVSKESAALDLWLKDIAPSPELRVWFNHQPEKFTEFSHKYTDELTHNPAAQTLQALRKEHPTITLLFAAKSPDINHAVVLRDFLKHH